MCPKPKSMRKFHFCAKILQGNALFSGKIYTSGKKGHGHDKFQVWPSEANKKDMNIKECLTSGRGVSIADATFSQRLVLLLDLHDLLALEISSWTWSKTIPHPQNISTQHCKLFDKFNSMLAWLIFLPLLLWISFNAKDWNWLKVNLARICWFGIHFFHFSSCQCMCKTQFSFYRCHPPAVSRTLWGWPSPCWSLSWTSPRCPGGHHHHLHHHRLHQHPSLRLPDHSCLIVVLGLCFD